MMTNVNNPPNLTMKKDILGERLLLRLVFSVCVIACFYYKYIWMTAIVGHGMGVAVAVATWFCGC